MQIVLLPFIVATVISFIATPIMRTIALKVGAVDIPKDNRRVHTEGIPYLGGVAIYLGVIIAMIVFLPVKKPEFIAILIGGTIIMLSGLIDDFAVLSPKMKLLIQILAGIILVIGGIRIEFITNPFSSSTIINLGILSIPITIFWVVGITNTVNLIDGLDGLSAGVAAISSISLMLVANKFGYTDTAIFSAILAGGCLGFLPFNFNPASIFMGDAGALFLGFILSAISIEGVMKSTATITVIVPIIILGIPIFDTTFAIFRRILNGQHPMQADKGHLHHRLLKRGYSQRKTVLILYGISVFFGVFAVLISEVNSKKAVILSIILLIVATIYLASKIGLFNRVKDDSKNKDKDGIDNNEEN